MQSQTVCLLRLRNTYLLTYLLTYENLYKLVITNSRTFLYEQQR